MPPAMTWNSACGMKIDLQICIDMYSYTYFYVYIRQTCAHVPLYTYIER